MAELFASLEYKESRSRAVTVSAGLHVVLVITLLLVPFLFTDTLNLRKYSVIVIAPPPPEKKPVLEVTHWKAPEPPKQVAKRIVEPPLPTPVLREVLRAPEPPKPKPAEVPKPKLESLPRVIETARLNEADAPAVARPKAPVVTGTFSSGSSAKPTVDLPAREVQTGGFGDPNGAKGVGRPNTVGNVASLGSFDLPVGAGAGNGTGGGKGVKGTVASAGFGNGAAVPVDPAGGRNTRQVQQGSFGDTEVASAPQGRKIESEARATPAEITFKPRPEYTDQARQKRIEGEVLVRVQFTATGQVRVLDVVRGLGYGLDENALRAAQQIQFKPAQRDGRPVDSTATVHIVFQLAY